MYDIFVQNARALPNGVRLQQVVEGIPVEELGGILWPGGSLGWAGPGWAGWWVLGWAGLC